MLFLMIAAQIILPCLQIVGFEDVLSSGVAYKFKTAPVDPNDPFRGKYISLAFKCNIIAVNQSKHKYMYGQKVYSTIGKDSEGFATITSISLVPPQNKVDYFQSEIVGLDSPRVTLSFPFDKFYMEETKAPQAEVIYRKASIDTNQFAYALVRIKDGKALIQDVYINSKSLSQLLNTH